MASTPAKTLKRGRKVDEDVWHGPRKDLPYKGESLVLDLQYNQAWRVLHAALYQFTQENEE